MKGGSMSAWIVSKEHIDALVSAALVVAQEDRSSFRWYDADGNHSHELTYTDTVRANQVGRMLWAENLASINARYTDTIEHPENCPGPNDFNGIETVADYTFKRTPRIPPVAILKAINCYEYQTCEHEGWPTSQAKAFCDSLTASVINSLPGYDESPWGIDASNLKELATWA